MEVSVECYIRTDDKRHQPPELTRHNSKNDGFGIGNYRIGLSSIESIKVQFCSKLQALESTERLICFYTAISN